MKEIEQGARQPDAWQAWQQALAEVPATPALSGALLPRWDDLFGRFVAWYGRLRSRPRAERRRWQRQLGLSLAGIALLLAVNGAPAGAVGPAATITVSGPCDLIEAIGNANDTTTGQPNTDCDAGNPAGADTIDLQVNVVLTASNNSTYGPTGLPAITSAITIQGNGKTISRSSATDFRILAVAVGGNLTLNSATVSGGVAGGASPAFFGGGIYNRGALTVQNSTLSGNSAGSNTGGGGGGIFNRGGGTLTVQNSILSGNSANAGGGGGGIDNLGTLTVQSSTLSGNSTSRGGGIRNYFGSTATVSNSTFSGNSAFNGGGIANNSASLAISNSTFSGNSASRGGGIDNRGTLTVQNSTLSGNSAFNGGGIYSGGFLSTVAVMNSTLSGNSAFNGGGIYSGGILSTVAVMNSIVAAQTGGADCSADGTFNSGGYNIESATSCNFIQASDLRNVTSASLALQPLANNGGPTQTQALGLTSVAVDRIPVGALEANGCVAGTSTDQRNAPRAGGAGNGGSACDVGAYEYASTPLAVALAGFDAQAMVDHIQLSWETVSEINNSGFNLYRSASSAGPSDLLAYVPSQAPGSTQGASYSFDDTEVTAGQTWYYWLEDVDLSGATSLHGPVSATIQAPTAVTLDALEAQAANPGSVTPWGALVAALIAAAGVLGVRRRSRVR